MNLEAFGGSWKFAASADRKNSWQLHDVRRGETIAIWQWALLNNISEAETIREKCRFHGKLDNREVEVECSSVYPFGGEATIDRTIAVRDHLIEVRADFKPGRGEVIRNLELEKLVFPGEWQSVEIVPMPETVGQPWQLEKLDLANGSKWQAAKPFAALLLTDADGYQIELGVGGDYWRMCGEGASGWEIACADGAVTVSGKVVAIAPEMEIQRRPWRFSYYLAWGRKTQSAAAAADEDIVIKADLAEELGCECFRAPAVRKFLRKVIRQQQEKSGNLYLMLPGVKCCDDAGHLERPGKKKLRHWDLDELFALYSWGNRALGEGRELLVNIDPENLFCKFPSVRYLAAVPGEAMVREI